MDFLTEHYGAVNLIISVAIMGTGFVITWTKMRDKIDALVERANDNKAAIQRSYIDLKEMMVKDLIIFRADHDRTRQIMSEHVMDTSLHQSPEEKAFRAEWREAVMKRLERIEEMISDIHQNVKAVTR